MIKRVLLRGLLSVVVLLMTLISVVTLVLVTEPGTRWLLDQVRGATALEYQQLDGNLMTGVRLEQVQYTLPGGEYRAEALELSWHPAGVIWGALVVDTLAVTGLDINLTTSPEAPDTEPQEAFSWPELSLPVAIVVRNLTLDRGYVAVNDQAYYVDAVTASARYGPGSLVVDELQVRTAASEASLSGSAELSYPYSLDTQLNWDLQPLPDDSHASDVMHFVPAAVLDRAPSGQQVLQGDITDLMVDVSLQRPFELSLAGRYLTGLDEQPAAIDAELSWPRQPIAALGIEVEALVGSDTSGTLAVNGWLDDYNATLQGEFIHPNYPSLTLSMDVSGDTQHLVLHDSAFGASGSTLEASGQLDWADGLGWDLALNAEHLNPGMLLDGWPGDIQAEVVTKGVQREGDLDITVDINTLAGQLRGLALNGRGAVAYNGERWQFTDVAASLGANQVAVSGSLSEQYNIAWDIQAPILAQIDPSLGGSLTATGKLSGNIATPKIALNAEGEALHWQDYQVANLSLHTSSDDIKSGRLMLTAEASELLLAGVELAATTVVIDGGAEQHTLSLDVVQDGQNDLQLMLAGGWDGEQWRGDIEQLQVRSAYARTMNLRQPAALELAADAASLQSLCMVNQRGAGNRSDNNAAANTPTAVNARLTSPGEGAQDVATPRHAGTDLCLAGTWRAQGLTEGAVTINRLPLALLRRWLKDEVDVEGFVQGKATLHWPAAESQTVALELAAQEAAFIYHLEDNDSDRYPMQDLHVTANYQDQQLSANLGVAFEEYGQLQGTLKAHTDDRSLDGKLDIALDNLSPLEALLPAISNIKGALNGAVNIAGSLDAPSATVDLALADGALELPSLGVDLTALNATVRGDHNNLALEAQAAAGEGSVSVSARGSDLLSSEWRIDAGVEGERAKVMAIPALTLWLTPDIDIKVNASSFDISGSASVPEAHAVISTLPVSATKVSDDVVVIDAEKDPGQSKGMAMHMNLDIALGDKVTLDAAGFKARIGGNMSLNKVPERAMYAVGNIEIIDGRYQSFGQNLTIERGILSFQGPLDDPGLNVTATREVEETTVGLMIGGTLQQPVTEIFSRPQVSDSNAMSMLFTGKPLDGASSGEGAILVNAIAKLGIKRGQFLADDIAGRFGLDELTIKSDDDVKDSRLWLGKYITEDLYVHYAIGLFDSLSSVGLTYFLNDNFRIEAESGEVQSADLIFRMQR
ncbi:translocation/assembly module TamB domain-containing protein [Gilvimarinus agarilyticus]|uniref:translocation/assembly module TamB domain-containing protein n=1 Tax=Gilvimarinus agarilyticus TaxID=679259 RepID=UPI00059EDB14|nr:translocation/assembly module TamB domain-containing protein [Gilvimarinus agarilyticus]